jgi:Tat protein secretion system quality control protein TatD with DNase activity
MTFIDNRHHYHRWFVKYDFQVLSATIYTTYGTHPKYLASKIEQAAQELNEIFGNGINANTITVGVGECGLDQTRSWSYDHQLIVFRIQLRLATEFKLPLVLHGHGQIVCAWMPDEMRLHLDQMHRIHWHCINPKSDLTTMT